MRANPQVNLSLITVTLLLTTLIFTSITPTASAQVTSILTDKTTYTFGEDITIRGTASPNSAVAIQVTNPKGTNVFLTTAKADGGGNFERVFKLPPASLTGEYTVVASEGGVTKTATFTLFSTGPLLTITLTPAKAAYTIEVITIEVTSSERLQNTPAVTITQAGVGTTPLPMVKTGSNQWSASYAIQRGYNGAAIINATGANLAGNIGATISAFTVDTTSPVISITAPEVVYEPQATISGTVDDATVGFIDLSVDAQPPTRVPVIHRAWSSDILLPATGPHTLRVDATDLAGNTGFAITTTSYITVAGFVTVAIDLPEDTPGNTVPIWVYTTYEGRPVAVSNISGKIIQPNGADVDLTFTAVKTGLLKASYTIPTMGTYTVTVDVSWRGISGTAFKVFQAAAFDLGRLGSDLAAISTSSLIAAGLSLAAAAAAIAAVVQITRKLVLK